MKAAGAKGPIGKRSQSAKSDKGGDKSSRVRKDSKFTDKKRDSKAISKQAARGGKFEEVKQDAPK